jgi:hypothetical protein
MLKVIQNEGTRELNGNKLSHDVTESKILAIV